MVVNFFNLSPKRQIISLFITRLSKYFETRDMGSNENALRVTNIFTKSNNI